MSVTFATGLWEVHGKGVKACGGVQFITRINPVAKFNAHCEKVLHTYGKSLEGTIRSTLKQMIAMVNTIKEHGEVELRLMPCDQISYFGR